MAGWRFEREYLEHLREERERTVFVPLYYYYTGPRYRFERAGGYYFVDGYGADMLRQAVELGYQQGFEAGQADRQDSIGFSLNDDFAYSDATYGYAGYVELADYQYYFRQGFIRGYDDGYWGRYQYGVYSDGLVNIIGGVLNLIFNPQPY
jgi:hypothetical protein